MKKYLRFEVSGLAFFLWLFLFLLPHINLSEVAKISGGKVASAFFGLTIFSIPASFMIHQLTITLLSPFRKNRIFDCRTVIERLNKITVIGKTIHDDKRDVLIVYAKMLTREYEIQRLALNGTTIDNFIKNKGEQVKEKVTINVNFLAEEISNRYSYYYGRIENGFVSPLLAFLMYILLSNLFSPTNNTEHYLSEITHWPAYIMPLAALIQCIILLTYIPVLFNELNDLENLLVDINEDFLKGT